MLSIINSMSLHGLDGFLVSVEVDVSSGMPSWDVVGLPDISIKESKERVKTAIKNSGIELKSRKVIINLSPADIKKEGSIFDLAIAIGILVNMGIIKCENIKEYVFIGELSLNGKINKINGILPMCIEAKKLGINKIIIPKENEKEASIVKDIRIIGVKTLNDLIKYLNGDIVIKSERINVEDLLNNTNNYKLDFSEVKGQENVKRALEIAAVGGHNCIMIGSPGSGKTMMAKRLVTILPELTLDEAMEITKIHSISGELRRDGLMMNRPFRMPHHSVPISTIIGGGRIPKPGEISLAHYGVLFFDELTEFNRSVLESLREPLENREVTINRLSGKFHYPCNFMFVASMNPCPCGYYGDNEKECKCTPQERHRYLRKISGPLLDRIDIQIEVKRPKFDKLTSKEISETSADIRKRVDKARQIQLKRYKDYGIHSNAELNPKMIIRFCKLDSKSEELLQKAFEKFKFSARTYERILKVARTVADLDGKDNIEFKHVAESIQYRGLDKFIN